MSHSAQLATVASVRQVRLRYRDVIALDGIDLDIPAGRMVGLIGPDGVGKSSLLSLLAGVRIIQEGTVEVLGGDMASKAWGPLDANKTYKLFVLSFNATGGDGYTTLANIPAERRMDIGVLDADVLQTWIDRISEKDASGRAIIRKLPVDQYSTQYFAAP